MRQAEHFRQRRIHGFSSMPARHGTGCGMENPFAHIDGNFRTTFRAAAGFIEGQIVAAVRAAWPGIRAKLLQSLEEPLASGSKGWVQRSELRVNFAGRTSERSGQSPAHFSFDSMKRH